MDKLKALRFDELEEEMETARDVFLFACYTGAAYCDLMELSKRHLVRDDTGSLWLKFNRQKTGVLCRIKLLPGAVRLIEKMHSDERETLLPYIKYKNYQTCLKALRLRAGISFPFTTHSSLSPKTCSWLSDIIEINGKNKTLKTIKTMRSTFKTLFYIQQTEDKGGP